MNLLTDLACVTPESFDIRYITEMDPLWEDDDLVNPSPSAAYEVEEELSTEEISMTFLAYSHQRAPNGLQQGKGQ